MRNSLALLVLSCISFFSIAQQTLGPKPSILVLSHVTVIDATGSPAQPDVTVVITGDRITEMEKSGKIHAPKDAQVVDATGKFLIPGLWDMHVHLDDKDYLPLFLANGVTGVRVMFGDPMYYEWR